VIRLLAASTVGLLLLFVPGVATATPRWAPAASATIRPGVALLTPLDARSGNACTANFVYTAGGGTYLGMAAHCAGTGSDDVGLGLRRADPAARHDVLVRRSDGGTSDAELAYSSWITMRERGERDSSGARTTTSPSSRSPPPTRPRQPDRARCWAARTAWTPTGCARVNPS
jgi:hypothetical protein